MLELVLDTSICTAVAIVADGQVVARQTQVGGRKHAELLTPLIEAAAIQAGLPTRLVEAGFDRILVGIGPGPFTGLRAGLVTARALGFALDVPVLGVSTLDMLARQALDLLQPDGNRTQLDASWLELTAGDCPVLVVSDAKRREVYWGLYRALGADDVERLDGPDVSVPLDLQQVLRQQQIVLAGPAASIVCQALELQQNRSCNSAGGKAGDNTISICDISRLNEVLSVTATITANASTTENRAVTEDRSWGNISAERTSVENMDAKNVVVVLGNSKPQDVDVAVLSRIVDARLQKLGVSAESQSWQNPEIQQLLQDNFPIKPLYLRRPDVHQKSKNFLNSPAESTEPPTAAQFFTQSSLRFGPLDLNDAAQMATLEQQLFTGEAWSQALVEEELQSPWSHYFGVFHAGKLLGYAGYKGEREADLTTVAVVPEARRRGLGRSLLELALADARKNGVTKMVLEVRTSNLAAQRLYTSLGFQVVNTLRGYYQNPPEDALLMVLKLTNTASNAIRV